MASKKRRPDGSGQRTQGKGLSGNPQKRAQQLLERGAAAGPRAGTGRTGTTGAAPGGASRTSPGRRAWSWWAGSHRRVIARARELEWPSRLLDIEELAGRLAGDEFRARVNAPGEATGLNPAGWLRGLTEAAFDALTDEFERGGTVLTRLWALCCGLADTDGAAELDAEIAALGPGSAIFGPGFPVPWYRPTEGADVLVARDAYGSRFLLAAPFSDPARPADPDHWYAWDLDWCPDGRLAAGGAYASPEAALAEWAPVVGRAADGAALESCPPELAARLLSPALDGAPQTESVFGDEPAEFFRELPRLLRRSDALAGSLAGRLTAKRSAGRADDRGAAIEEFLRWHAGNAFTSPGTREASEDALELILGEWGPDGPPDEQSFYACSPHRVEVCAAIMRDSYEPDAVNAALALLPAWVQWCAERAKLPEDLAGRALAAARAEAAVPDSWGQVITERSAPFRRPE